MGIPIKQSTTVTLRIGQYVTLDGSGAKTGLNVTTLKTNTKISKNNAAGAALNDANAFTEDAGGYYFAELNTTDTATLGRLTLYSIDATNYSPMSMEFEVLTAAKYSALYGDDTNYLATDVEQWKGTAVASPATAGIPDINTKNINNVSASSVTTINANQGTTQPINLTGTGASALVKGDAIDWASGAIPTPNVTGVPIIDLKYILGTVLTETAGQIAAAFKKMFDVSSPVLTSQSVNQTGDAFARIGVAGVGLTNLGDTRIAHLDADVSSRTKPADTQARVTLVDTVTTTATATNLTNAPTAGDFTATMKTSLNAATPSVTVSDKTGFSLSSAGIQAIWDRLTSALTTVGSIGKLLVDNINATIASVKTKTDHLPDSDMVNTSGKLWVLDGNGNAIANETDLTSLINTLTALLAVDPTQFSAHALALAPTGGGGAPTVQQIVDGVWDELSSAHLTPATMGYLQALIAAIYAQGIVNKQITIVDGFDSIGDLHITKFATYSAAINTQLALTVYTPTDPTTGDVVWTLLKGGPVAFAGTIISYDAGTSMVTVGLELTSEQTGGFTKGLGNFTLSIIVNGVDVLQSVPYPNGILYVKDAADPL